MKYFKFKVTKMNEGTPSEYTARFHSTEEGVEVFEAKSEQEFSVVSIVDEAKATEITSSQDSNIGIVEIQLDEFTTLKESSYTFELIKENLQTLKNLKLDELNKEFKKVTTKTPVNVEGIGVVDGGRDNLQDVNGVIKTFKKSGQSSMQFRLANNEFATVDEVGLDKIEEAIILKGQELYQKKWAVENSILSASSFDEIMAVKVEF